MIAKATSKAPHAQAAASSGPKSIAMLYWFASFRESSSEYAIMMERRMACKGWATTPAIRPGFWCGKPGRSSLMNFISVILLTNSAASGMAMAGTRSSESCPVMVCSKVHNKMPISRFICVPEQLKPRNDALWQVAWWVSMPVADTRIASSMPSRFMMLNPTSSSAASLSVPWCTNASTICSPRVRATWSLYSLELAAGTYCEGAMRS